MMRGWSRPRPANGGRGALSASSRRRPAAARPGGERGDQIGRRHLFARRHLAVLAPGDREPGEAPRPAGERTGAGRKIAGRPQIERPQIERKGHDDKPIGAPARQEAPPSGGAA
jgi:hypothetical protein